MYEEKERKGIQINWKSLLIKLAILFVVVFLIIWIISLFNRDDGVESNFGTNLSAMRDAATEYFTGSRLPSELNESSSITLGEMFDRNLLVEFQDENGNPCDTTNSYAEATKISDTSYRIEVRLVCENDSDTIINTIERKNDDQDDSSDVNEPDDLPDDGLDSTDDSDNDDSSNDNQTGSGSSNGNNSGSKPNNGNSNNNNNNQSGSSNGGNNNNNNNSNNDNNNNNNNNNNNDNNNNQPSKPTCTYGKNEYFAIYPLAYVVSGDCAVSYASISGSHSNAASRIGVDEYLKLIDEMTDLEKRTGAEIEISTPQYSKVKNKTGNGYVGYQIYFAAKQKISTYATKTIYSYYLDTNGNRKVIIDNRSSLYHNSDNNNDNETQTVAKTYYYVTAMEKEYNDVSFLQTVRLTDLDYSDIKNLNVKLDYFGTTTTDYRNYANHRDLVEHYDYFEFRNNENITSYTKMLNSSVKKSELDFEVRRVYHHGDDVLIDLNFDVKYTRYIPPYGKNEKVFVPVKINVTYTEV